MAGFGELLEKLGRNAGLSALERMQLRTKGRDLEALGPAMSVLFGPGEVCRIGTATNQTISNNTLTRLTGSDVPSALGGKAFSFGIPVDVATGSILLSNFESPSIFLIGAFIIWAANSTGIREVRVYSTDSLSYIDSKATSGSFAPSHAPSFIWRVAGYKQDDLNLRVLQTSGGDLDVDFWHFWAKRIR